MADFGPDLLTDVVATCNEGAGEAAEAFTRALDQDVELSVGEACEFEAVEITGGGLLIALYVEDVAAVVVIPESTGLLPSWCATPDATGESKLTTLAQELGMILLPEAYMPLDFKAAHVADLPAALKAGEVAGSASLVRLQMQQKAGPSGEVCLIWPAPQPKALFPAEEAAPAETAPKEEAAPQPKAVETPPRIIRPSNTMSVEEGLNHLPPYFRSLLKIKLPLSVTLAETTISVEKVISLGAGSIIQFDKSCEESLDLQVGDQKVAIGEAVKVGDKFGLRISSMKLPDERFHKVEPRRTG